MATVCNELAVSLLLIWLILKTETLTLARCHLQSKFGASRWRQDRVTFDQAVIE